MWNKNIQLNQLFHAWYLGITPLILRDFLFRSTLLGFYYGTTHIEHSPNLKFSMSEMLGYLKYCREVKGENATFENKKHLFIDYHNYQVKTKMNFRFLLMLLGNLFATVITNPIDVWLTKLLTQQERKYKGLIDCMIKVYREEGIKKFLGGVHPRFMFNAINGTLFLYIYDQAITAFYENQEKMMQSR